MENKSCANARGVCCVDVVRAAVGSHARMIGMGQNGALKYANDRLRHNEGIVAAAVGQLSRALQCASPKLCDKRNIVGAAATQSRLRLAVR